MNKIQDFCPRGGWLIDTSNSKQILIDDRIVVSAIDDQRVNVQIVRKDAAVKEGSGALTANGNIYVPFPDMALVLSLASSRLLFAWENLQGGGSPDGGGSGGTPGGHG